MEPVQAKRRNFGVGTSILFLLCFFILPQVAGCDGGTIIKTTMNGQGGRNILTGLLLIGIIVLVGIALVSFITLKFGNGSKYSVIALAGAVLSILVSGTGLKDFNAGGLISFILLISMSLVSRLPDPFLDWVPLVPSKPPERQPPSQ